MVGGLVDHLLEVVDGQLDLVENDVVVDGASSTLDSGMGAEVKVILERMSDVFLHKSTRKGIAVTITRARILRCGEEADVVTLGADNDSPLDLFEG